MELTDAGYGNTFDWTKRPDFDSVLVTNNFGSGTLRIEGTTDNLVVDSSPMRVHPVGNESEYAECFGISSIAFDGSGSGQTLTFDEGGSIGVSGIPTGTNLEVDSGTQLDLSGDSETLGSVTVSGGSISDGIIRATPYRADHATIGADLTGPGGLTSSENTTLTERTHTPAIRQ